MLSIRIIEIAPSLARRQAKWPWTVPFTAAAAAAAAAHRGGQIAQRARDRATAYFTSCVSFVSYLTLWNGADEIQYRSTATAASSSNTLSSLPSTGLSIPWNASTAAADNCQPCSRFPRILLSQYMWVINSTSSGLYPDLFNVWNKSNCTKLHKSPATSSKHSLYARLCNILDSATPYSHRRWFSACLVVKNWSSCPL